MPDNDLGIGLLAECFGLLVDYVTENRSGELPGPHNHMAVAIANHTDKDWYLAEFTVVHGMSRGNPPLPASKIPAGKTTALYVTTLASNVNGTQGFRLWYKIAGTDEQILYMDWEVPQAYWGVMYSNSYRLDQNDKYNYKYAPNGASLIMEDQNSRVQASIVVTNSRFDLN